jgi:hypothetical protein
MLIHKITAASALNVKYEIRETFEFEFPPLKQSPVSPATWIDPAESEKWTGPNRRSEMQVQMQIQMQKAVQYFEK